MKRILILLPLLAVLCVADDVCAAKEPDLALMLAPAESTKSNLVVRLTLENLSEHPVRVLFPSFGPQGFGPGTALGGYSLEFMGPDGKPADLDWGPPLPSASPAPPEEKDTVVLRPGMSIGLRVTLAGALPDPSKVSHVVAHYDLRERPEWMPPLEWNIGAKPPLWRGSISSSPLMLSRSKKGGHNKRMEADQ